MGLVRFGAILSRAIDVKAPLSHSRLVYNYIWIAKRLGCLVKPILSNGHRGHRRIPFRVPFGKLGRGEVGLCYNLRLQVLIKNLVDIELLWLNKFSEVDLVE